MEYQIRIKSNGFQFFVAILFCSIIVQFIPLKETHSLVTLAVITFLGVIGLGIGHYLTRGLIKTTITGHQFELKWIKKPLFTTLENRTINFDQISGWRFRNENYYDYFSIYTKIGNDLTFYRDPIWDPNKDDLGQFLKDFENSVNQFNDLEKLNFEPSSKESVHKPQFIEDEEASFHKSKEGKLVLIIYILTLVFGSYMLITKWDEFNGSQPGFIIAGLIGCITLIINHFNQLRKH